MGQNSYYLRASNLGKVVSILFYKDVTTIYNKTILNIIFEK